MRLFVAVELPAAAQITLARAQEVLAARLQAAGLEHTLRWVSAESIHLTLRFLGETSVTQKMQIEAALERTSPHHLPFAVEIAGLGAFPSFRRPNVLWTGVRGLPHGLAALQALQAPIEQAARDAAFPVEDRPFAPHLTLARFRREANAASVAQAGALLRAASTDSTLTTWRFPLPVGEIVLMRSDLRPKGAIYTPIARHRLGQ